MEAKGSRAPKLDLRRIEAEAGPVRRPRDLPDGKLGGVRRDRFLQGEPRFKRPGLRAGPGADAAAARPTGEVGVGFACRDRRDGTTNAHLPLQALPVKTESCFRVGR